MVVTGHFLPLVSQFTVPRNAGVTVSTFGSRVEIHDLCTRTHNVFSSPSKLSLNRAPSYHQDIVSPSYKQKKMLPFSTSGQCLDTGPLSRHQGSLSISLSLHQEESRSLSPLGQRPGPHQGDVWTPADLVNVPLSLFTRARARSLSTPEQCLYLRAMSLSGQRFSLCAMTATPLSLSLNSQSSFSLQYFLTGSCFNARAGDTWCRCNAGTERRSSRRDDW